MSEWKWQLFDRFKSISEKYQFHLDHINSMPDHIHLLNKLHPSNCLADVVKIYKAETYDWINTTFPSENHFHWQDGYAGFSVSPQNLQKVRGYIRNQEKHHQTISYKDELKLFTALEKI